MEYTVRTRYGWGWEVTGQTFQSSPIESSIAAQEVADALNEGKSMGDAFAALEFRDGRFYHKVA